MKQSNIFKKDKFKEIKKEQLAKITGGDGGQEELAAVLKTRHDTAKNAIGNIR